MCTLLFRIREYDEYPVAVLANRDEIYDRPVRSWQWRARNPTYFAPEDGLYGGTWMGVNEHGLVTVITNIFPSREDEGLRSRGLLVNDILALPHAQTINDLLPYRVVEKHYNYFNLFVADPESARLVSWNGKQLSSDTLPSGTYQVNNQPFDGRMLPDKTGIGNRVWLERMAGRLKEHPEICKHGENYGTRSSHKILLHRSGITGTVIWHLDGHPCRHTYNQILGSATTVEDIHEHPEK